MQTYPSNWKLISAYVRFVIFKGVCQRCGDKPEDTKELHCAHLDHDKTNCKLSNLVALCCRCHPAYDTSQRIAQTQINFSLIAEAKGQMRLF